MPDDPPPKRTPNADQNEPCILAYVMNDERRDEGSALALKMALQFRFEALPQCCCCRMRWWAAVRTPHSHSRLTWRADATEDEAAQQRQLRADALGVCRAEARITGTSTARVYVCGTRVRAGRAANDSKSDEFGTFDWATSGVRFNGTDKV
jgi:hypothetical protein